MQQGMYANVRSVYRLPGGFFYGEAVTDSGLRKARFDENQYVEPLIDDGFGPFLPEISDDKCPRVPKADKDRIYFTSSRIFQERGEIHHKLISWTYAERMREVREEFNKR